VPLVLVGRPMGSMLPPSAAADASQRVSGSMRRVSEDIARVAIEAIRAQGRRALVSRGWADLAMIDDRDDCLGVGEVNHQAAEKGRRWPREPYGIIKPGKAPQGDTCPTRGLTRGGQ
jgi:hypothetical protein